MARKGKELKPVEDVVACVVDYGTFIPIAEKLAETMRRVYYYSPFEIEYQDVRDYSKGFGLDHVEKLDELFDERAFNRIDLFVFPDIGFGALQRHLRSQGFAVWGHLGATELELNRDFFLNVLESVGLPVIPYEKVVGLNALKDHLRGVDGRKWIKINRFRNNMDTWRFDDYESSEDYLESLSVQFGAMRDHVIFIVQDDMESEIEIGYDGWCIDGQYPPQSWQGYEKKNELYLGSVLSTEALPPEIRLVNEAMAPVLAQYGYRGWWATEIRKGPDGLPYFIDPTPRMPGQTGEHQLETMANFADVIWRGANGIVVPPDFAYQYVVEATIHFDPNKTDATIVDPWKSLQVPTEIAPWFKGYHYSRVNGVYKFGNRGSDEVGVLCGVGNSIKEAIDHLHDNLRAMKELPVHANPEGFADLLKAVKKAEKQGVNFGGGKIPAPESVLA